MSKDREDLSMNDILTSIKKDILKTPYNKFDLKTDNYETKNLTTQEFDNSYTDENDEDSEIMDLIDDDEKNDEPLDLTEEIDESIENTNSTNSDEYDFRDVTKSLSENMNISKEEPILENQQNIKPSTKPRKKTQKQSTNQNEKIDKFLEMIESSDENLSFNESLISETAENKSLQSIEKILNTKKRIQSEEEKATMMTRTTIDDLALAALTPMLKQWIDTNLNSIVEKVIQKEIENLINKASSK